MQDTGRVFHGPRLEASALWGGTLQGTALGDVTRALGATLALSGSEDSALFHDAWK